MVNILIPIVWHSPFFDTPDFHYPKPLIEILGKAMIERVIDSFAAITEEKRFIFVTKLEDCKKFHLDSVLEIITDYNCKVIKVENDTKGAACSALLAVEFINNDEKLIISNGDQVINENFNTVLQYFESKGSDAGVVGFDAVHPRWSYALQDDGGYVIETAEKRPISRTAIAGFYYYKHGKYFVESAMASIKKNASTNGMYYIASSMNELILSQKKINVYKIEKEDYHSFYSPAKIREFESYCMKNSDRPCG